LVIDHSSSMYFPIAEKGQKEIQNKITFSVQCAAALAELLKMQRDAVGLSVFGEEVEVHTPARSSNMHHKLLFNEMEKLLVPLEKTTRQKHLQWKHCIKLRRAYTNARL